MHKRPLFFALFSFQGGYFAGSFGVWERLVSEGISNVASIGSVATLPNKRPVPPLPGRVRFACWGSPQTP